MLNGWAWFGGDIELCELGPHLEDIDASRVENLFGRWDGNGEVGILGQPSDEEHEATGFDLHLSKVRAAGWNVRVLSTTI